MFKRKEKTLAYTLTLQKPVFSLKNLLDSEVLERIVVTTTKLSDPFQ